MKKAMMVLLLSMLAFSIHAEDEKAWSFSLDQAVYDKYVWRGIQFNEEGVNQGSADFSYDTGEFGTFGINYWYNLDMDDENGSAGQISEADYTLYWEMALGESGFTLGAGFIYYDFSEVDLGSTKEVYMSLGYDTFLSPTVTVYYDIEDADGLYVDLSVGHSFDLGVAGMTLDVGANIAWADDDMQSFYYGGDGGGLSNWGASVALNIPVLEYFTITPSIAYYQLIGDANSDTTFEDDDFIFGVNLNFTF
jgi:hypothetical protein